MFVPNAYISEYMALLGSKVGTANSTPLVMTYVQPVGRRVLLIASLGDMANETIDIAIYKASDASATGAASLKAATQLAASATANDNKQVYIDLAEQEMDTAKPFLAGRCVTSGATGGVVSLTLLQTLWREQNVLDVHNASLVQIKR